MAKGKKVRGAAAGDGGAVEQPLNGRATGRLDSEQQILLSERHYKALKSLYLWEHAPRLCGGHTPHELDNLIRLNGWLESSQRRSLGEYVGRALCFGENFNPADDEHGRCCLSEQSGIARTLWAVAIVSYAPQPLLREGFAYQEVIPLHVRGGRPQVIENFGVSKDLFRTPVGGAGRGAGARTKMGTISFSDYTLTVPMHVPAKVTAPNEDTFEDESRARSLALEIEKYVEV